MTYGDVIFHAVSYIALLVLSQVIKKMVDPYLPDSKTLWSLLQVLIITALKFIIPVAYIAYTVINYTQANFDFVFSMSLGFSLLSYLAIREVYDSKMKKQEAEIDKLKKSLKEYTGEKVE